MRNLIRFLLKHHLLLLFLFLEFIAVVLLVRFNSFQSARIFKVRYSVVGGISSRYHKFSKYLSLEEQNRILIKENARLYNTLKSSKYSLADESKIDSSEIQHFRYIPATVVNNSVNKQYNYITINRGKVHGVKSDMGVIGPDGLVGIVKASSEHFSTIIPILNREFYPSGRIKNSGFFGPIEWPGKNYREVVLKDIPLHAIINIGDTVVTSGITTPFPSDIMIGTITDYKEQKGVDYLVTVKLATDFKKLTNLTVTENIFKEEQQFLEDSSAHD